MNYTVKKSTAMVYHIRTTEPERTWANITIEEWPEGGSIKCVSDYGNYSYIWGSIGKECFRQFLCHLDYYYFMGKTHPSRGYRFSASKSVQECKRNVIQARKDRDISKEQAREYIDFLGDIECEVWNSESEYYRQVMDHDLFRHVYNNDGSAVPHLEEKSPECDGFWNLIWPVAKEIWTEEINSSLCSNCGATSDENEPSKNTNNNKAVR